MNDMAEQIRQAEEYVGGMSINEALYGGPRGPGLNQSIVKLNDNVTALSTTVAELSKNMQKVSDDVNGGDGVRVTVREMSKTITELQKKVDSAEKWIFRIFVGLSFVGLGTMLVLGRVGYNIWEGTSGK